MGVLKNEVIHELIDELLILLLWIYEVVYIYDYDDFNKPLRRPLG